MAVGVAQGQSKLEELAKELVETQVAAGLAGPPGVAQAPQGYERQLRRPARSQNLIGDTTRLSCPRERSHAIATTAVAQSQT